MKRFIPYEKLSKRERKARDAERRGSWGISPVTRRPEKPGAYNRAKARKRDHDEPDFAPLCSAQKQRIKLERSYFKTAFCAL